MVCAKMLSSAATRKSAPLWTGSRTLTAGAADIGGGSACTGIARRTRGAGVLAGRDAERALEAAGEVALVDETDRCRDLRRRLARRQHALGMAEPQLQQIGVRRQAVGAGEQAAQ